MSRESVVLIELVTLNDDICVLGFRPLPVLTTARLFESIGKDLLDD